MFRLADSTVLDAQEPPYCEQQRSLVPVKPLKIPIKHLALLEFPVISSKKGRVAKFDDTVSQEKKKIRPNFFSAACPSGWEVPSDHHGAQSFDQPCTYSVPYSLWLRCEMNIGVCG